MRSAPDPGRGPPPTEVGCWSHVRRNFWEAAVCKHALGVEGLRRIDAIFAADAPLADLAPAQRQVARDTHVRPRVDAFFAWVAAEYARPRERGLVATALGYAVYQADPLRRIASIALRVLLIDSRRFEDASSRSGCIGRSSNQADGRPTRPEGAFTRNAECLVPRRVRAGDARVARRLQSWVSNAPSFNIHTRAGTALRRSLRLR